MRKKKRLLSILITGALLLGNFSTMAYADDVSSKRPWNWKEEDGVWHCYDAADNLITNQIVTDKQGSFYLDNDGNWVEEAQIITLNGKKYCIDDKGEIRKDELFLVEYNKKNDTKEIVAFKDYKHDILFNNGNGDGGVHSIMYAYPDGHLAKKNWVMIEKDGSHMSYEVDQGDWYWFNGEGSAIRARQRQIGESENSYFLFNPSGKMYQSQWVGTYNDNYEKIYDGYDWHDPNAKNEYYSHFGNMVKNQYLYLTEKAKGDEGWYWFDSNGKGYSLNDLEDGTATPSNAQAIIDGVQEAKDDVVSSIEPRESNVQIEVGKTVKLYYDVERASASDASTLTKHHDIYVVRGFEKNDNPGLLANGSRVKSTNREANGVVSVEFVANAPGKVDVVLIIDDQEAAITVESVIGNDVEASTETVVDSLFKTSGTGMEASGVKALKEITTDSEYQESKDTVLNLWKSNKTKVSELEKTYLTVEGMMTDEPAVSEKAAEKLQGNLANSRSAANGVSVVGAALAVDSKTSMVQLNVDIPEDEESINKEYEKEYGHVTSLDITLLADGKEQSELPLPILIDIPIPAGFNPEKTEIYHLHEGEGPVKLDVTVENGSASFAVDKLSTFVFVEKENAGDNQGTDNDGSEGGSSSIDPGSKQPSYDDYEPEYISVSTDKKEELQDNGEWLQDGFGWWHKNPDGTYPANKWEKLAYNGKTFWYFFDALGYMKTGWIVGPDGNWYYLNPSSNGFMGAMVTGWQQIDGFWYYFNAEQTATEGAMYVNTITPDGYKVNELGQWIQ